MPSALRPHKNMERILFRGLVPKLIERVAHARLLHVFDGHPDGCFGIGRPDNRPGFTQMAERKVPGIARTEIVEGAQCQRRLHDHILKSTRAVM